MMRQIKYNINTLAHWIYCSRILLAGYLLVTDQRLHLNIFISVVNDFFLQGIIFFIQVKNFEWFGGLV